MSRTFLAGIISDPHIARVNETPYKTDVRKNFLKVIDEVTEQKPDHLIITGDICYREFSSEIYNWLKNILDTTGIPYSVIPGNHDNSVNMAKTFALDHNLINNELYYTKILGNRNAIFLDTSKAGMSSKQMEWLKEQLATTQRPPLIFMHHPPCLANVKFMDKNYPFLMINEFLDITKDYKQNIPVFCGHYHVYKTVMVKNLTVFITGSTFFTIDQESHEFKKDISIPGWRLIELTPDSIITITKFAKQ